MLEGPGGGEPQRARDRGDLGGIGRQGVRLVFLPHLDGMLDPAQEPIRLAEKLRLPRLHQPVAHELVQRRRGGVRLEEGIPPACSSWNAWTMNSISRMPPWPDFTSRASVWVPTTSCSVRVFMAATSASREGGGWRG